MAWAQLELEKAHIAYACVGIFSTIFSLLSLFVKERLYIGEASVATIAGLIFGPHCLDWFNPISWGNTDYITLEICRIVLCIQIVAVAVELPRKYMKNHWVSVSIFLLPVMTSGWLIVGLFIWILIPHLNFSSALVVSACVTATDPILAAAVVGKGKFAERVPGHLRNILSAESGCNDGMAFPFIFLSLNLVIHAGNAGEIVKDWIVITILWECLFGIILGVVIGFSLKRAVAFAEQKNLIDRESFLAIFVFIAFNSAGLGSILGVDDLLVSFAAGTAFGWNGDFAKKTEESHVSTVIDLLLNLAFFVYFGAIVPWPDFNNPEIGLNVWRLIVLAIVVIFLRRVPAVVAMKPFTPDIKTWREAFFCGHFGPIGVGAIFAVILARKELEGHYTSEETPLQTIPKDFPHYQLLKVLWPMVCFIVVTSIIVHGSSVAVLTLGKRLNRMAITMSFTTTNTQDQGPNWMARLQKLEKVSTSFSLHRLDNDTSKVDEENFDLPQSNTVETSGIKVRPAGGAKRKKRRNKKNGPRSRLGKTFSRVGEGQDTLTPERQRPQTEFLQLGKTTSSHSKVLSADENDHSPELQTDVIQVDDTPDTVVSNSKEDKESLSSRARQDDDSQTPTEQTNERIPTTAFQEGKSIIIEDQNGEIVETISLGDKNKSQNQDQNQSQNQNQRKLDSSSIHSMESLRRNMSQYSTYSEDSIQSDKSEESIGRRLSRTFSSATKRRAFYRKNDPTHRKVYAHQVDDLILIENEDGEIIRRYRVNRHVKERQRSSTLVGKALSLVGIKGKGINTNDQNEESPKVDIKKLNDLDDSKNPLNVPEVGKKIENKLNQILNKSDTAKVEGLVMDPYRIHPLNKAVSPDIKSNNPNDSSESQDSEYSEEYGDEESSDDDILQETEVEKKRRLAALGISTSGRHDDDEEE